MAPALMPQQILQEMEACALLGASLGTVRGIFPKRGRAAFLPDLVYVGVLLLALQSYAAGCSIVVRIPGDPLRYLVGIAAEDPLHLLVLGLLLGDLLVQGLQLCAAGADGDLIGDVCSQQAEKKKEKKQPEEPPPDGIFPPFSAVRICHNTVPPVDTAGHARLYSYFDTFELYNTRRLLGKFFLDFFQTLFAMQP